MIIRVEKHTSHFSIIDNTGLNDIRLGLKARGLLGYLLTKPDNWEITVQGIISQVPDGKTMVQSALKELERFGYAEYKTVRVEGGRLGGKRWVIYERSILESTDNQPKTSKSSDHRQTGFPIIGKTDYRKNRLSENQLQVSTNYEVSTDKEVSTVLRTSEQKKSDSESSFSPPPNSAAPPPNLLFSDSGWPGLGLNTWHQFLSEIIPDISPDQSSHYFNRCEDWSSSKGAKSKSWIEVAANMYKTDLSRKKSTNERINAHQQKDSKRDKLVRATNRAARFVDRNGV